MHAINILNLLIFKYKIIIPLFFRKNNAGLFLSLLVFRLLMLQWKQDIEAASKLIRKAIELDDKCDFAYETLATLEVQK